MTSLETGTVGLSSTIDDSVTASVSFNNSYNNPVVVTYIASRDGGQSIQSRAKNVTSSGCDIHMEEPDNQGHNSETVVYIVCESGVYNTDGYTVEADIHTTNTVRRKGDWSTYGDSVSFSNSWSSTPIVLHNLQTYNNSAFMATQSNSIGTGSFNLSQEALETGISASTEEIGWIAITPVSGGGSMDGVTFETNSESDGSIDGVENTSHSLSFSSSFSNTPDVIVSQQTLNGNDGSYARSSGTQWNTSGHEVYAEEDQVNDSERGHADETFGYLAIEPNSTVSFTVKKTASATRASTNSSSILTSSTTNSSDGNITSFTENTFFSSSISSVDGVVSSTNVSGKPLNSFVDNPLTLYSDGQSHDPSLGLTSDSLSSGGKVGPFYTKSNTKSSSSSISASAVINDESGSGYSESEGGKWGLEYNGSGSGDRLDIPHDSSLNFTGDFTIAFRGYIPIDLDINSNNTWRQVIGKNGAWDVYIEENMDPTFSVHIDGNRERFFTNATIPIGEPYYCVCRYDSSTGDFDVSVNGTTETANYTAGTVDTSTNGIDIGHGGDTIYRGLINDVRVDSRRWSDSEVSTYSNNNQPSKNFTRLHLDLNEGSGSTVYDSSGYGNNGNISGPTWRSDTQKGSVSTYTASTTSDSISSALHEIVNSSTVGSSTTSSGVEAFFPTVLGIDTQGTSTSKTNVIGSTKTVDKIRSHTSVPLTQTGVVGDTEVATFEGQDGVGDTIANIQAAQQIADVIKRDGEATTDAFVRALRTVGETSPATAVGEGVAIPLGEVVVPSVSGVISPAIVERIAYVSPENATAGAQAGSLTTEANVMALTKDTAYKPLTPSLGIVVGVDKGDIGLEGAFADSLSASVGAQTYINVAKTVGQSTTPVSDGYSSTVSEGVVENSLASGLVGSPSTSVAVEGVITLALLDGISDEHTVVDVIGAITQSNTDIFGNSFSATVADSDIPETVVEPFESVGKSTTTVDALHEAANAALNTGVVDTSVEAAAIAAKVAGEMGVGIPSTETTVDGFIEEGSLIDNTSQPNTESILEGITELMEVEGEGKASSSSNPDTSASVISSDVMDNIDTTSISEVLTSATSAEVTPFKALLRYLWASITGNMNAEVISEQNVRVMNTQNEVEIL